jgi:hypothetical protein
MNKITVNHEKISCLLSSPIQNPPEGIARIPTTSEKEKKNVKLLSYQAYIYCTYISILRRDG